jgi:hypothetical protein
MAFALPMERRLAGEPGWRVAYRDPQALLLVRAFDAESAPTVQRDDLPTLPFEPFSPWMADGVARRPVALR